MMSDYSKQEILDIVEQAAKKHGVPRDDFLRFTAIETGFTYDERAYNRTSGASGLFQFVEGTARQYGIAGREFDPVANADAGARLYNDNKRDIIASQDKTGRPFLSGAAEPNGLDLYMAHQQGAGGYASIQKALDPADGSFIQGYNTRRNILGNIGDDLQSVTGIKNNQLSGMSDRDLAQTFMNYWQTKYNRIEIPEKGIKALDGSQPSQAAPAPQSGSLEDRLLLKGEQGPGVQRLQEALNTAGIKVDGQPVPTNGKFDDATERAVKAYQQQKNLEPDGKAGRDTLSALGIFPGQQQNPQQPAATPQQPAPAPQPAATPQQPAPAPQPTPTPQQPAPAPQPTPTPQQPAPALQPAPTPQQPAPAPQPAPTPQQPAPAPQPTPTPQQPAPALQPAPTPQQPAPAPQPAPTPQQPAPAPVQPAPTPPANDGRITPPASGFGTWPAPNNFEPNPTILGDPRYGTLRGEASEHAGFDIGGKIGDPVVSALAGKVDYIGKDNNAGWMIQIDHGNGLYTMYQHLHGEPKFKLGDPIAEGQKIGEIGVSGNATSRAGVQVPQLHFEVRRGSGNLGTDVNPSELIMLKGSEGPKVKELEQALQNLKYDVGKVDGVFDEKTGAAVKKWQADNGMKVTGVLDGNGMEAVLHPERYRTQASPERQNPQPGTIQPPTPTPAPTVQPSTGQPVAPSTEQRSSDRDKTSTLVAGNNIINDHYKQAFEGGAGRDPDIAARAVGIIQGAKGYKPDEPIAVIDGRYGKLVTQGEGPTGLNIAIGEVAPGEYERVSKRLTESLQPTTVAAAPSLANPTQDTPNPEVKRGPVHSA
jgi:murein DD-endopeptidase MepM/ murein hydrolase activator NlpD